MRNCSMKMIGPLLIPLAISVAAWTSPLAAQSPGRIFRDCDVCPEMVVVPSGSFMMGDSDYPQHRVTIDYTFAVGVYEVTFEEWDACVSAGGCGGYEADDEGWGRGRRPVINVSWDDAWAYADWLTDRTGEEYRLLSEAEWEYVARAGTETAHYWRESEQQCQYANGLDAAAAAAFESLFPPAGCDDGEARTATVGRYLPNRFRLHDVLGNVSEWVEDCYALGVERRRSDGTAWYDGDCSRRVYRGGSWLSHRRDLRAAANRNQQAGDRRRTHGFRLARTIN